MALRYVFADEAGNFDFSPRGSRYFILTTIVLDDFAVGDELQALRRDLGRRGIECPNGFHATTDAQAIRDEVYRLISRHNFRIDATIFEKSKTIPHLREEDLNFYKTAWHFHTKFVLPQITGPGDELLVVGASITLRKKEQRANEAIAEVLGIVSGSTPFKTAAWSSSSEPCLQVADYCCWAIQRKWERGDDRSYVLIKDRIRSEFDIFQWGKTRYY